LFVGAIPVFNSGERFNVISKTAYMEGTIRSLEMGVINVVVEKI
jgi:metal-dependent amidase/aminoacylase/carboxypeptidase family protein